MAEPVRKIVTNVAERIKLYRERLKIVDAHMDALNRLAVVVSEDLKILESIVKAGPIAPESMNLSPEAAEAQADRYRVAVEAYKNAYGWIYSSDSSK